MTKLKTLSAPLLQDSLISEQIRIEEESTGAGIRRYWDQVRLTIERGEASQLMPIQRIVAYWLPNIIKATEQEQRRLQRGELSVGGAQYGPVLLSIRADIAAATALNEVMNYIADNPDGSSVVTLGFVVGRAVVSEINADRIKGISREWRIQERAKMEQQKDAYVIPSDDGDIWRAMTRHIRRLTPQVINRFGNRTLGENAIRQRRAMVGTGIFFLNAMFNQCVLHDDDGTIKPGFVMKMRMIKRKRTHWFSLHEATYKVIEDGHRAREAIRPRYLPMIVEPYPWKQGPSKTLRDGVQGGYVSIRTPLVGRPVSIQKNRYLNTNIEGLLGGLNAISKTPWQINPDIYPVVKELWNQGGDMLEIPPTSVGPKPPVPHDIDTNPDAKEEYKQVAREWYCRDVEVRSLQTTFGRRMAICEQFIGRKIYFPHLIDFRTRAYPIPAHLNHQGPDLCRGLLEFGRPVDIGNRGFYWLCVHAANCYGIDKVTFQERVDWVDGNMSEIVRCANDPLSTDFWHKADGGEKPWQFLAACMAIVNPERGVRMPVQMDGTCNVLQHYAMMLRDEDTANMVNMVENTSPSDLYSAVAKEVKRRVSEDPTISQHADIITRSLVKPPVMTSNYGVTIIGMREQLRAYMNEKTTLDKDTTFKLSRKLSEVIQNTMKALCSRSWGAMDYLRQVANAVTARGFTVEWTTPIGFPAVQPYTKQSVMRVSNSGVKYRVNTGGEPNQEPKRGKQRTSFAPNFIHSFDASHMFMTAEAFKRDFAAAHDCFMSHAGNTEHLRTTLAEEMIKLYSRNHLKELQQGIMQRTGVVIPEPPPQGNYDINRLRNSPYAFN